jgi:phosphatidylethanolamine/phosphatidyl-N-methylethanolamine N-methyltransferase
VAGIGGARLAPRAPGPAYRASQQGYRLVAPAYDALFGLALGHGRRTAIAALDCRPGERVLEIGVGSGLSLGLYPAGVEVVGIDVSGDMLARAQRRRDAGPARAALARMDAGRLAFADASFDKVALLFTIGGLPAPAAALAPLYGLLRYRVDLDAIELAAAARLRVLRSHPANLFGYATVLVCRAPGHNERP